MKRARCEYGNCKKDTIYQIGYNDINGIPIWSRVCGSHDRQIGRRNLMLHGWSLANATKFERNPEIEIERISNGTV